MHGPIILLIRSIVLDYFLLLKWKLKMKMLRYELMDHIQAVVTLELNDVKVKAPQKAFTDLYTCSNYCIELGGNYVEA